jgi:hypothetical protein
LTKIYQCDICNKWFKQTEACVDKCITLKAHGTCCHKHEEEAVRGAVPSLWIRHSNTLQFMLTSSIEAAKTCENEPPKLYRIESKAVM